jgi:hypothetical protein
MKKVLLTIGIILIALSIMAPEDKAEKLRHEDNGWEKEGQQFVVQMSCKFGIATAGEHADFKVKTILTINAGGKEYTETGERNIQKVEGASKDADGYVKIEPTYIQWDRDGGIFGGAASVQASASIVGPSGNDLGDVVESPPIMIEVWPDSPVKHDNNNWDYDPENDAIVVPLLAHAGIVDIITEGYQVEVDVDVWNDDEDQTYAGSGEGSAAIVKIPGQGGEYVQIQPALAYLDDGVSWNGDDDGTGIVSGTIKLVSDGTVHSITTFENQTVGFVIPPPDCGDEVCPED